MDSLVDLDLLARWQAGWSLARGVGVPRVVGQSLVVDVGWAEQRRRHLFVEAGAALRACAAGIGEPAVYIKATVDRAVLAQALPAGWRIEAPRFLMACAGPMAAGALPEGYRAVWRAEHGASVLQLVDADGVEAASGRLVLHRGCAVFDRIETAPAHRRRGLGRAVMQLLDGLAQQARVGERLLVASVEGRQLYLTLGWTELAPYASAVRDESA